MSIFDLLPTPPWEGPPFPRFVGIVWPWLIEQESASLVVPKKSGVSAPIINQAPLSSYQNEESWDIEWSDEGLPVRIVVHRNARRQ